MNEGGQTESTLERNRKRTTAPHPPLSKKKKFIASFFIVIFPSFFSVDSFL